MNLAKAGRRSVGVEPTPQVGNLFYPKHAEESTRGPRKAYEKFTGAGKPRKPCLPPKLRKPSLFANIPILLLTAEFNSFNILYASFCLTTLAYCPHH